MKKKTVSVIMLTMLLMGTLTLAFNLQALWAETVSEEFAVVYVDPSVSVANKPEVFTISINIFNVTELWGWGLELRWKRGLLWCKNAVEGTFLNKNGTQDTWWIPPVINNLMSPPNVILSHIVRKGGTPVNGSGNLANVTFSVTDAGNCVLELFEVKLRGVGGVPIPPNTGPPNYYFTNLEHGYFYTTHPVASFTISPDPGTYLWRPIVGETVTFNGSKSYDPDDLYDSTPGGITSYYWDFGDGGSAAENDPITTHTYTASGRYAVTLKVTDDETENGTHTYPQLDVKLHDIALINVTAYPAEVATGATVTINATVLNEGSTMEYLNVTVYYDYNPIEERVFNYTIDSTVKVTLSPGKNETSTIPWDTTGVAPGTYMIGAKVELIRDSALYRGVSLDEWEADKTDNAMFAGPITILGTPVHDLAVTAVTVDPTNIPFNQVPYIGVTVRNEGNIDETFNATVYCNSTLIDTKTDVTLSPGHSTTLTFVWSALAGTNTTQEGTYSIMANVTIVVNETDIADNSHNITKTMRLLPYAKFTYSPTSPPAGQTITFDASSSYLPGIPPPGEPPGTIVSYEWDFGDGTTSTDKIPEHAHTYDRRGTYSVTLTVTDNRGLTGTYFKAVSVGHDHDVAVINVTPLSTKATSGGQVSVNVTVTNKGTWNETFTVIIYYDDTVAAFAQSVTDLVPNANTILTFVWDTTGVTAGTYTMKAMASPVTGETYLEDNTLLSDSLVTILKLHACIDGDPDVLNLRSEGRWITAFIQLPVGYNSEDIDATTILLNETFQPVLDPKYDFVTNSSEYLVDHDGDGLLERMVKFNRAEVASWVCIDLGIQYGNVTLTVTGELLDGTPFEGKDTIKVLFPGDADDDGDVDPDDLFIFAGCYGISIENPSYNPLADFNEDGYINSEDFYTLSRNYGKTVV